MVVTVFGGYDQAGLDAQYNNREMVPEAVAIIERWVADSAAARQRLDGRCDLAYGPGPRDRLDLFLPRNVSAGSAGNSTVPLLAFIHGGYWQVLDKNAFSFLAEPFVAAGIAFAAIGYPLAPDVGLDDIGESVRRALQWLWRNAGAEGYDPDRIHVAGHSAGGHLTAVALATDWAARGLPPALVRSGCAISGLYDLEPIRLSYLNAALGMDAATARRNSPVHNLVSARGHLTTVVGSEESDEFHRQQAEFMAAWRGKGLAADSVEAPGCNHFTVLDEFGSPESSLYKRVTGQILQ